MRSNGRRMCPCRQLQPSRAKTSYHLDRRIHRQSASGRELSSLLAKCLAREMLFVDWPKTPIRSTTLDRMELDWPLSALAQAAIIQAQLRWILRTPISRMQKSGPPLKPDDPFGSVLPVQNVVRQHCSAEVFLRSSQYHPLLSRLGRPRPLLDP